MAQVPPVQRVRAYVKLSSAEGNEVLMQALKDAGARVDIVGKKPANPKHNGNRDVISISVTGDTKQFQEKLDQMLKTIKKTRSEWYCEQVANYVSENMHY